jgi:glutamate dehydrogenase/leucine dehydrogenase
MLRRQPFTGVIEGSMESCHVEDMDTTTPESLATKLENLIQEHIETTRKAAAEALQRAFSAAERTSVRRSATTKDSTAVASKGTRRYGKRRTAAELEALAQRFHQAVCDKPGELMAVLAPTIGVTPRELHRPVAHLKDLGRIRSAGQRTETRYFPMMGSETVAA